MRRSMAVSRSWSTPLRQQCTMSGGHESRSPIPILTQRCQPLRRWGWRPAASCDKRSTKMSTVRCVGYFGSLPVLRAHYQQRPVCRGMRGRATQQTSHGNGIHERRSALVRILRWRPDRARRLQEAGRPGQHSHQAVEDWGWWPCWERASAAEARQEVESVQSEGRGVLVWCNQS